MTESLDPISQAFADAGLVPQVAEPEPAPEPQGPPGSPRNPGAGWADKERPRDPFEKAFGDVGL